MSVVFPGNRPLLRLSAACALVLVMAPRVAAALDCVERGFLDVPAGLQREVLPRAEGWVWSASPITSVDVLVNGQVLARGLPDRPRADVAAAFAGCSSAQPPGFGISFPVRARYAPTDRARVVAHTADGRRLDVGELEVALDKPFGAVENGAPVTVSGDTSVHGWAWSAHGAVTVSVRAGDVELASAPADRVREDVAAAYGVPRSGFELPLSFQTLPRGRYELRVRLRDAAGHERELRGPEVINDRAIGVLEPGEAIRLDGDNVLRGWSITAEGSGNVRITARGTEVAVLKADRERGDVGERYVHWPHASRSGFEHRLAFSTLPRGRYRLRLAFADAAGEYLALDGPEVHNDFPIGRMLGQRWRMIDPGPFELAAWVADEDGIAAVRLTTDGGTELASLAIASGATTYAAVMDEGERTLGAPAPSVPLGQLYRARVDGSGLREGLTRLEIRVTDNAGRETRLPGPLVLRRAAAAQPAPCEGEPLRLFFPGDTEIFRAGAVDLQELRAFAAGPCVEVGLRGRVEYLRTTHGREADYRFDPAFPDSLRLRREGTVTSTALDELLALSERLDAPLLVTLDGGPWADARFAAPDIDIVDVLEEEERAVQWNQHGRSEPDTALSGLPGSFGSPQLARMMSLNIYNEGFRRYKRRNLEAAVGAIVASPAAAKGRYVAVNLDPDQYVNPWFYRTQWYDYNPDTLRQFRAWLTHGGPYAPGGERASEAYPLALDLAAINRMAGRHWTSVEAVEPPRAAPDYADPWHQAWTAFKRHQVGAHYDDLARWAVGAGMDPSRVFTSQTFIQTDVAVGIHDAASGWTDEAGVSVQGARPAHGHLGAILYGPASRNEGAVRRGHTLFQNIRDADPQWAVVELHPATIEAPERLPTHEEAYATVSRVLNFGARFVSPMWGTNAADRFVRPDAFRSYDAFTGSDFEYQLLWWLIYRRSLPAGSLSFPFGNARVQSADGWSSDSSMPAIAPGYLRLAGARPWATLVSAPLGTMRLRSGARLVVQGEWRDGLTLLASFGCAARQAGTVRLAGSGGTFRGSVGSTGLPGFDRITLRWVALDGEPAGEIRVDDVRFVDAPAGGPAQAGVQTGGLPLPDRCE